jgi:hypothetical protein
MEQHHTEKCKPVSKAGRDFEPTIPEFRGYKTIKLLTWWFL